jgi:hypothetical protein
MLPKLHTAPWRPLGNSARTDLRGGDARKGVPYRDRGNDRALPDGCGNSGCAQAPVPRILARFDRIDRSIREVTSRSHASVLACHHLLMTDCRSQSASVSSDRRAQVGREATSRAARLQG